MADTAFEAGHAGKTETRAKVPVFQLAWERLGVTSPRDLRAPVEVGDSFFSGLLLAGTLGGRI